MGDVFTIQVFNELLTYEVDKIDIVEPSDVSGLQIETGSDYVTLITCTPYGVNSHRLLVRGHRIPNLPEDEQELVDGLSNGVKPVFRLDLNMLGLVLLGLVILGSLVFLLVSRRKRKRAASAANSIAADTGATHTPEEGPVTDSPAASIAAGPAVETEIAVAAPESSAQARLDAELEQYAARMRARQEALGGPGPSPGSSSGDSPGESPDKNEPGPEL